MGIKFNTPADAFLDKMPGPPPPADECWLWAGLVGGAGYGQLRSMYRVYLAHRVSYEMHVGDLIPGLWVLHSCDVRLCVQPAHLSAGTPAENTRQMYERGRGAIKHGELNEQAKLSNAQVAELKEAVAAGHTQAVVAKSFGISQGQVSRIMGGKRRPKG